MLHHSDVHDGSLFTPENLLREARRQKSIAKHPIPGTCVLDPDGDIVRYLLKTGRASLNPHWACYHTQLYEFTLGRTAVGIVGCAVGSPFAVLIVEEMFASGCQVLLSITSAGRINAPADGPRFLVIERAIRDEGTSSHYLAPSRYAHIAPRLLKHVNAVLDRSPVALSLGTSWTTDAPFRETAAAISRAGKLGADCVEMEAAALYAFAKARKRAVVCVAHVTNSMAQSSGDFEKGPENGSVDSLKLLEFVTRTVRGTR
jgi:uridine phosphorylase